MDAGTGPVTQQPARWMLSSSAMLGTMNSSQFGHAWTPTTADKTTVSPRFIPRYGPTSINTRRISNSKDPGLTLMDKGGEIRVAGQRGR